MSRAFHRFIDNSPIWISCAVIALGLAVAIGWVMNLIALAHMTLWPLTGLFVLRVVGIFIPPIGGVLGYI